MTREEAIKVAYGIPVTKAQHEALQFLIPELRESEDERMIERIELSLHSLKQWINGCDEMQPSRKEECITEIKEQEAWLKKQKEQKPILEVFGFKVGDAVRLKDGDGRKHIIKSFEEVEGVHGPNFYHVEFEDNSARDGIYPGEEYPNGYYTQMEKIEEEQKPTEWSEEDEEMFFFINELLENKGRDYFTTLVYDAVQNWLKNRFKSLRPQPKQEWNDEERKILDSIIDDYEKASKSFCGYDGKILVLKAIRDGNLPKPAWSEEDEKSFNNALSGLKYAYEDLINHKSFESAEDVKNAFDWLKFLHPQSKKEFSIEKAIQWLDDNFYFLDNSSGRGRDCEITTHDFDSLEEMYDSFRKAVTVDSEPHWKPSEEQMEVLERASTNKYLSAEQYDILVSLYEQLKQTKLNVK